LIAEYRTAKGLTQKALLEILKIGNNAVDIDNARLSRLENGEVTTEDLYTRVCDKLGIDYHGDKRLSIGFGQGFWAAALVTIDQHHANTRFREHTRFSAYSDSKNNEPIWSAKESPLPRFDEKIHSFYYSGEILEMLRDGVIDIGFLGSSVVEDDKDIVRAARIVDASSLRHVMVVAAPKGQFSSNENVIEHLLTPAKKGKEARVYYQAKSTAEKEFQDFLQWTGHYHNTIPVLNLPQLKIDFQEKLRQNDGQILAHIGLLLSATAIEEAIHCRGLKTKYETFVFRTIDILTMAQTKGINELKVRPFYYEMVVQRSNEKILEMTNTDAFKTFIKELRKSVDELNVMKNTKGTPLIHRKVSDFFGLDEKEASDRMKNTDFELLYYPEFINKILNVI
jgi:transcriptional regulator with XRE-family HTH domain